MRKLVSVLVLGMAFATFAQDEEQTNAEFANLQEQQAGLTAQVANLEAQIAELSQQIAQAPVAAEATPAAAAPSFPRFRQSGSIAVTPRMELDRRSDAEGESQTRLRDVNRRRLMLNWSYRLGVDINERVSFNFRIADPYNNTAIFGSSVARNVGVSLIPYIPHAYFVFRANDNFRLSGGLLEVRANSALNLQAAYTLNGPTNAWSHFHNSVAGFNLTFPINSSVDVFAVAGLASQFSYRDAQVSEDGRDTIAAYNDGRVIVGANISLADRAITLRPMFNAVIQGDVIQANESAANAGQVVGRGHIFTQGIDASFRLARNFALNADFAALQHNSEDLNNRNLAMFRVGAEPVVNFGGENNRLFTARVRYAFETLANNAEAASANDESAVVHFVDARLAIAVAPRFTITPRYRVWAGNFNGGWWERDISLTDVSNNNSSRAQHRFEVQFATSF